MKIIVNFLNSLRVYFKTKIIGVKLYIGDELWKRYPHTPSVSCTGLTIIQEDKDGSNRMWFNRISDDSFKLVKVSLKYRDKQLNEFLNNIGRI